MLGQLEAKLKNLGLWQSTHLIVVSDHAHSSVSGPLKEFPLRGINNGRIGGINSRDYSVSGEVRSAALLTAAGFHAYDGEKCRYSPIMTGIARNGAPIYPTLIDKTGAVCGKAGMKYTSQSYKVPKKLPSDAIVVAANGGSDYFYVPSHDPALVQKLVTFLQSHEQYGAIFVNENRYEIMAGTLSLATVDLENSANRSPDVVAGFNYNAHAKINGLPGIEFSDYQNQRGIRARDELARAVRVEQRGRPGHVACGKDGRG